MENQKNNIGTHVNGTHNPVSILEAVASLKNVGFEQEQAETLVQMQYRFSESYLASKHDLEFAKLELKKDIEIIHKDIEQLRAESKNDIALVRKDIEQLRSDTKNDIEQLRADTKRDVEAIRKDIEIRGQKTMLWLGGIVVGSATFCLGFIFTMAKLGLLSVQ